MELCLVKHRGNFTVTPKPASLLAGYEIFCCYPGSTPSQQRVWKLVVIS